MADKLTRQSFIHHFIRRSVRPVSAFLESFRSPVDTPTQESVSVLLADLPQDLLIFEARRRGLDPNNREEVLDSISRDLEQQSK